MANMRSEFPTARIGWERPEKLHLTVKFLGDTDAIQLRSITDGLQDLGIQYSPLNLRLDRTGVFPSRKNPRIFWVGIDDLSGKIGPIHDRIQVFCEEFGFERDRRSFRPHVTIGRVRHGNCPSRLIDRHLAAQIEPVGFEVSAIAIYESRLQPTGSIYSVLSRANLG